MRPHLILAMSLFFPVLAAQPVNAQPVITDSRIKTLVYNENDVYRLLTHHGYQAHIEFSPKETIDTISVGNKTAWQIIPDGRRLFIRSLVPGSSTNLTVITNKRSYQFDIESTKGGDLPAREDLVYVVRFYYPDEFIPKSASTARPPVYADEVIASVPEPTAPANATLPALNFDYTFTGDQTLVPSRIFDDGKATYFQLKGQERLFTVAPDGREIPVATTPTSDGFQKAAFVSPRFVVRNQDGHVCIYNERMNGGNL